MPKKPTRNASAASFILGRGRMDKISAVEGIKRGAASQKLFSEFDRKGLSTEARRRALIAAHGKKA